MPRMPIVTWMLLWPMHYLNELPDPMGRIGGLAVNGVVLLAIAIVAILASAMLVGGEGLG